MNLTQTDTRTAAADMNARFIRLENELLEKTLRLMNIPMSWLDGGDAGLRNIFLRKRVVAEWLRRQGKGTQNLFGC
jgi:hypothetical protein